MAENNIKKVLQPILKAILIIAIIYLFLLSIKLLGHSFKSFGHGFAEALINMTSNPFSGIIIGVVASSLIQSSSTTTSLVVGLVAGGLLLIVIKHWTFKKKFYLYLVLAVMGLMYFAPYTFWARLDTITEAVQGEEVERSAYSRLVIGEAMIEMFQANILGYGHRGTVILSPDYLPAHYLTWVGGKAGRSSHCTFLTTLTEQGLPGAFLYLLMVYWVIKNIFTFRKDYPVMYLYFMGATASLAAIFISGIFVDYLKVEIQIYCFAMLASLKDYEIREQYKKSLEA